MYSFHFVLYNNDSTYLASNLCNGAIWKINAVAYYKAPLKKLHTRSNIKGGKFPGTVRAVWTSSRIHSSVLVILHV
jgi:hypothetical protein